MDKFQVIPLFLLLSAAVTANIQLVGNGYEGVVVSISADIDVNPDLLTTLESILTNGSRSLFRATKNQLYFREFIVVLPENWPRMNHYENALDLVLDEQDFIIDVPNEALGFTPYVRSYGRCGVEGIFMHLTPTYILDETERSRFGEPGVVITHEWGHLRYGVADEYALTQDERFYPHENQWFPTRCSLEVNGFIANSLTFDDCQVNATTGRPEENCRFFPSRYTPAVASIMFGNYLQNIVEFCDNATTAPDHLKHNVFANNRQNKRCSHQSVWEVMRLHQDFISLSNQAALPNDTDTQPRFRFVQAQPRRRVLVLDTSGSMAGDPLTGLRMAASSYILSTVETGSQLGIVEFNGTASTLSQLVEINSDGDREALVNALPSSASSVTSIGAGLLLGLQKLNETGQFFGGSLILITDGAENTAPWINDVIPNILEAGVVVHSLSYGQQADPQIANLSLITGGAAIFHSGSPNSTALLDGLTNTVTKGNNLMASKDISIQILTEANIVTPESPLHGTFYIDSTIGNGTTLTFSFTGFIQVEIESPDGPYNATSVKEFSNPNSPAKVLRVGLEDDLTPGLWSYKVMTNAPNASVLVNIQSKPRRQGQEVIQIHSWLSQKEDITFTSTCTLGVYTEVVRGRTPVIDASAIATVETPSSGTFDLVLVDNGLGFDIVKDDGIYSGSIIANDFSGNGRYNVKINVIGTKENTKVFVSETGSANKAGRLPTLGVAEVETRTEPLEDFQRVETPGEFRLKGFTPLVEDRLPPGRIVDFEVKKYDAISHEVTLEWTAVGGNLDRGQAARYIIYKSLDVYDIIGNSASASRVLEHHVVLGNLSSPLAAGQREEFVVFLQELGANDTETVYMSISAVDEAGNEGETSTLAIVSDAREMAVIDDIDENIDEDIDENSDSNTKWKYLAIAAPVAFVIIATIVIAVLVLQCRNSREKSSSSEMLA